MKKQFARKITSINNIFAFISAFAEKSDLDEKTVYLVNLVVEELFTNAVKYIIGNNNPVTIILTRDGKKLIIKQVDTDVDYFDIRKKETYDFKKKLIERKVGGLGIPLVHKMVDKVDYQYKNRKSTITLIKYLENEHVRNKNEG